MSHTLLNKLEVDIVAFPGITLTNGQDSVGGMEDRYWRASPWRDSASWLFEPRNAGLSTIFVALGVNDDALYVSTAEFIASMTRFVRQLTEQHVNSLRDLVILSPIVSFDQSDHTEAPYGRELGELAQSLSALASPTVRYHYVDTFGWLSSASTFDGTHPTGKRAVVYVGASITCPPRFSADLSFLVLDVEDGALIDRIGSEDREGMDGSDRPVTRSRSSVAIGCRIWRRIRGPAPLCATATVRDDLVKPDPAAFLARVGRRPRMASHVQSRRESNVCRPSRRPHVVSMLPSTPGPAELQDLRTFDCYKLAAITFLYYDYFITFDDEVEYFWKRKMSYISALFFANRYFALGAYAAVLYSMFHNLSDDASVCTDFVTFFRVLTIFTQFPIGLIAILRISALYGRSRIVTTLSWLIGLAAAGLAAFANVHVKNGNQLSTSGCFIVRTREQNKYAFGSAFNHAARLTEGSFSASRLALAWGGLVIFDSYIFLMTLLKTISVLRGGLRGPNNTHFLSLILRDGAMFYSVLLANNVGNVVLSLYGRSIFQSVNATTSQIFAVILTSRLMFNLRKPSQQSYTDAISLPTAVLTPQFHSVTTTGPFGADTRDEFGLPLSII
ncbi:hypothetical protein PUNSTDRAFT_144600 [Punctularia strigosozonata HHB-11173 SS5]|uniref:uncharacterized protein n=1 Tax=Punctularia strigosozonata (strain HHB-11173) TaxID=741275 RepID=UPI00044166D4|nr:uncharacterized protein PUNSTDRAFT_144600 [Punctularia strigosozonata HHB-11173 SS5]EIN07028.1 hypothetical protein PUNSTDRAFT_144600 [Punctularia strigosozonata HHB-11173 SS5]